MQIDADKFFTINNFFPHWSHLNLCSNGVFNQLGFLVNLTLAGSEFAGAESSQSWIMYWIY